MAADIDMTDFRILRCIDDADHPLWKNRIHQRYLDRFDGDCSVQTVGRRVDRMHDSDLVQSCILSPDDINRDLIIGYQLSDTGHEVLVQKRRDIMLDAAQPVLFQEDTADRPISKDDLVDLICDEFQLDADTGELLQEDYTWEELTALVVIYLVKDRAIDVLTGTDLDKIADIITQTPEIADVFSYRITPASGD